MSDEQDRIFFRNYSIVIGVLALIIILFLLVARWVGTRENASAGLRVGTVPSLTNPIGKVQIEGQDLTAPGEPEPVAATAPSASTGSSKTVTGNGNVDIGKRVYSSTCFSCHGTGLPNIPQLGKAEDWKSITGQGIDVLYEHALYGFTGSSGIMMPAKGGNPNLSDAEVKAAVDYMLAQNR